MSRVSYVNGRYLPHDQAEIHIDDRGYQFGDGIYEVVTVINGKLADLEWHLDRLNYSLTEMGIPMPMSRAALKIVIRNMIRMNRITYGLVYFQITRGVMRRDHAYNALMTPQLVMTAKSMPKVRHQEMAAVKVITVPDQRWQRRDIKTLQLLPNCMAKTKAVEAGAYEAWMVDGDGFVTEGSSSNAWIVTAEGELITRPATFDILSGITRKAVIAMAEQRNLKIVERPFTPAEALEATEAFVTSATSLVTPVGELDGTRIGDGDSGPVANALRLAYYEFINRQAAE
ncbi:MAG: D-amino-acid transaminase [Alphaproteobacteria bacterium]|nr:D-amino-acid transaminase [Alphaproteobacteria bacterium]